MARSPFPKVYLASQSPRRKALLKQHRIPFQIIASSYHERFWKRLSARKTALRHARGKVRCTALVSQRSGILLGADTLVCCGKKILGKPKDEKEAVRMLRMISGRTHEVLTAVFLKNLETGKTWEGIAETKVTVRSLTSEAIRQYLKKIHPYDKAGAYAIQLKPKIVKKIRGSYSNVVGLPMELLKEGLKNLRFSKRRN